MLRYLLCFALLINVVNADWIFQDDNGDRHVMKDPSPNPDAEEHVGCLEDDPFMQPFPRSRDDRDDLPVVLCGKFYVSTDDPNVWIEVDDEEIGLEEAYGFTSHRNQIGKSWMI